MSTYSPIDTNDVNNYSAQPSSRRRELHDMRKDQLVALVLELEARADKLEDDVARLEEKAARDGCEQLLHERVVEMGLADGPLLTQAPDYRQNLARAIRRT